MITVINAACIQENKILLVKKRGIWIFPGGKLLMPDEIEMACLLREFREELPFTKLSMGKLFGIFNGTTHRTQEPFIAKIYFGKVEGELTSAREIEKVGFFSKDEFRNMDVSSVTYIALASLIQEKYIE